MSPRIVPDYAVPGSAAAPLGGADLEPFRQRIRTLPTAARHKLREELQNCATAAATARDRRYYERVIDVLHDAA